MPANYYRKVFARSRSGGILLAIVMTAISAVCAAPEGVLHTVGRGTTVNGNPALDGMHVFGGQLLHTDPGRVSDLLTRGSSLRLLGDTSLQFNGNSADLLQGGLALSTSTQFPTSSGCARITPLAATPSRYLVQVYQKVVYVTAEQNDVNVTARKTVRVASGKTVAVYCASAAQNIVSLGKDLPAKVIMGSAAAAAPLSALPSSGSKQDLSSASPFH